MAENQKHWSMHEGMKSRSLHAITVAAIKSGEQVTLLNVPTGSGSQCGRAQAARHKASGSIKGHSLRIEIGYLSAGHRYLHSSWHEVKITTHDHRGCHQIR